MHRALLRGAPEDCGVFQTLGVQIAPLEKLYVPDLVVMENALLSSADAERDEYVLDASEALLVAEITSRRTAKHDRAGKLWGYAHAPVPLCLLIDRFERPGPTVTLYSRPEDGGYQRSVRVPFGEPVTLPDPFRIELNTSAFPK